jgi:hypothetical protein
VWACGRAGLVVCVLACLFACVRACVCACVRARVGACACGRAAAEGRAGLLACVHTIRVYMRAAVVRLAVVSACTAIRLHPHTRLASRTQSSSTQVRTLARTASATDDARKY